MSFKFLTLSASLLALSPAAAYADDASDVKFKLSTGVDYSTGDYGDTEDTEIWYAPVTGKIVAGNLSASLTVPYLRIKGPGAVIGGGGGSVVQSSSSTVTTESGLGDVVAGLTYTVDLDNIGAYVDLTGKVKFPTADEDKGLGTGEFDYTTRAELTKTLGDAYVSGGVGYKFVGSNDNLDLDNTWSFTTGAGYQLTPEFSFGASYDYSQAAGSGDDPSEATAYANYKLTPDVNVQAYTVAGFSDGSPDNAVGVQIGYKFKP